MADTRLPPPLSPAKWGDLAREVTAAAAATGNSSIGNAAFLMEQRRLREGLVAALTEENGIARIFAQGLYAQLDGLSAENALESARQLLLRRAAEQQNFHTMLTQDPRFPFPEKLAEADIPPYIQPTGKFVSMLAQENRAGGPESVTHILGQAKGQKEWHAALSHCWQPGGAVHQALAQKLHALLPDVRNEAIDFAAAHFISTRYTRAVEATQAMDQDSVVVKAAKRLSHSADPVLPQLPASGNFAARIFSGISRMAAGLGM